ncbi:MAG: GAF domain-containing protein [Actinobacteria bacterium]|nr:GAF domain-containing protein [Actinomycetota bacterium]
MELRDAVDLYREVLRRYSSGFSLEEVLGAIAEAVGGERAVLFSRKQASSFLEPRLAWNLDAGAREAIRGRLLPVEWVSRQAARRFIAVDRKGLAELGLEEITVTPVEHVLLFPIRSHAYLTAVLLVALAPHAPLPDPQSFKAAAVSVVLERMVELFALEDRLGEIAGAKEGPEVELGILSDYVIGRTDCVRAASLSLDLLIKLFNVDGGTVHRLRGPEEEKMAVLIASRGWGGMPDLIEHLFEENLPELLQSLRRSGDRELSLDANRISEFFPAVKPYFHANQVKSFLLTPIFREDQLVGILTLFGRTYTAMGPQDMELLVQVTHRLGELFAEEGVSTQREARRSSAWDLPAMIEDLTRIAEEAADSEGFLSSGLRKVCVELSARMGFAYMGGRGTEERSFLWYADAVYGGEKLFRTTGGLEKAAIGLQRMSVVKPESPAMEEMPASELATAGGLTLLLVPARAGTRFLLCGFYLPGDSRFTKSELDSLPSLAGLMLHLAGGVDERLRAEEYRRSLEMLAELEGELAACDDQGRALRILARGGRELFGCDRAVVAVIDGEAQRFEGVMDCGTGEESLDMTLLTRPEMVEALQGNCSLRNGVPAGESGEGDSGWRIAVPLAGRKGILGAILLERNDGREAFREFHLRLACFLAGQAVSVLESMQERARSGDHLQVSKILLRISRRLSAAVSLEEACGGLYRELESVASVDLFLASLQGKTGARHVGWMKGEALDEEEFAAIVDPQGALALSLARSGKLVRNNLNTFLWGPGEDRLALRGIRSYVAVPLLGEGIKGILLVGSVRGGAFAERETELIERAAGLLGMAVSVPLRVEALQARIGLLEDMCRRQEENLKTKTDLISMASHELRHPLTLIMGFSEVLREYGQTLDGRESREIIEKLRKAADRLRRSVINMMEVSRLESGKLAVDLEEVDLVTMVGSLVEELRARSSDNVVEVDIAEDAASVIADRDKLEIVLFNLMDNAAKYSPPGSRIEVFAHREGREVVLGVRDEGQGISEENVNLIFQPFRKGEGKEGGTIKGMGLGLYIVNKLVEAHDGRIEVRSERGKGSVFTVHIPQPDGENALPLYDGGALRA